MNITANAARMKQLPHQVYDPKGHRFSGCVRGEALIRVSDSEGLQNRRNAAAGLCLANEPEGAEQVSFFAWSLLEGDTPTLCGSKTEEFAVLEKMGFQVPRTWRVVNTVQVT